MRSLGIPCLETNISWQGPPYLHEEKYLTLDIQTGNWEYKPNIVPSFVKCFYVCILKKFRFSKMNLTIWRKKNVFHSNLEISKTFFQSKFRKLSFFLVILRQRLFSRYENTFCTLENTLDAQKKKSTKKQISTSSIFKFWNPGFLDNIFPSCLVRKFHENNTKNDFKLSEHPTVDFSRSAPRIQI